MKEPKPITVSEYEDAWAALRGSMPRSIRPDRARQEGYIPTAEAAKLLGIEDTSENSQVRKLAALVKAGRLEAVSVVEGGKGHPNWYRIPRIKTE